MRDAAAWEGICSRIARVVAESRARPGWAAHGRAARALFLKARKAGLDRPDMSQLFSAKRASRSGQRPPARVRLRVEGGARRPPRRPGEPPGGRRQGAHPPGRLSPPRGRAVRGRAHGSREAPGRRLQQRRSQHRDCGLHVGEGRPRGARADSHVAPRVRGFGAREGAAGLGALRARLQGAGPELRGRGHREGLRHGPHGPPRLARERRDLRPDGKPLHTDSRECPWAAKSAPYSGPLTIEVAASAEGISWKVNGKEIVGGKGPVLDRWLVGRRASDP